MAPKPRPIQRKPSATGKDIKPVISLPKTQNAQAMPPPPIPAPPPPPQGILVPEARALSGCLRAAAVKSAQVFRFYADTQRLHIHRHAPYPPRALVSSLGRELEKYDQLCDTLQSHINRAIKVLQRDLEKEQNHIKAEEDAVAAAAALASAPAPPNSPTIPPTTSEIPDIGGPGPKGSGSSLRRQSTISLSSLHRPAFPHKLDLSSAALRLNPEELGLQSGLASPVMLAPKSSISRIPPDFPFSSSGEVDIDLTLDDDVGVDISAPAHGPTIDPTLGNSADKPIELLDLDMELFGAPSGGNETSGPVGDLSTTAGQSATPIKQEALDFGLFNFQAAGAPSEEEVAANAGLLASLGADPLQAGPSSNGATGQQQQTLGLLDSGPSPASLFAEATAIGASAGQGTSDADAADLDLFLGLTKDEDIMPALFDMNPLGLDQDITSAS